jgi:hypothetical protein
MAQYAFTFSSGDTVTPTKLNNARTVSEIVDADIKSDAAIAGTKIAPNFGAQDVVTSGKVGPASNATAEFVAARSSTNAGAPDLIFEKSRGALTSKTVVAASDVLGRVRMFGYDGSAMVEGASIQAIVDGTPSAGAMPTRLSFRTTGGGESSTTERMRITSAGNVGIDNTSPTERLHVTGNIKASGFIDADTSFRGQATDSASAPSYTWTSDTNTGMFRPAADTIAFSEGGNEVMRIDSGARVMMGTNSLTSMTSGADEGFSYLTGAKSLFLSCNQNGSLWVRRTGDNGTAATFYRQNANVGTISVTTTATAYNTSSDYRLKQNVEPMVGGLAKLAALAPKTFEFINDPGVKVDGFIAHEVQAVVPQAVTGEKDGDEMQGLDHSKLVPVLVAAVQELSAKVAALEAA